MARVVQILGERVLVPVPALHRLLHQTDRLLRFIDDGIDPLEEDVLGVLVVTEVQSLQLLG